MSNTLSQGHKRVQLYMIQAGQINKWGATLVQGRQSQLQAGGGLQGLTPRMLAGSRKSARVGSTSCAVVRCLTAQAERANTYLHALALSHRHHHAVRHATRLQRIAGDFGPVREHLCTKRSAARSRQEQTQNVRTHWGKARPAAAARSWSVSLKASLTGMWDLTTTIGVPTRGSTERI